VIDEKLCSGPLEYYKAYKLLTSDLGRVFFKSVGDKYVANRPLHDIAITDIVWCLAFTGGVGGGGRISRNGNAIVLQWGRLCRWEGGNKRMLDSHKKALK